MLREPAVAQFAAKIVTESVFAMFGQGPDAQHADTADPPAPDRKAGPSLLPVPEAEAGRAGRADGMGQNASI